MDTLLLASFILVFCLGTGCGWWWGRRHGRKDAEERLMLIKNPEAWGYARFLLMEREGRKAPDPDE